jgi:hypothetical protein
MSAFDEAFQTEADAAVEEMGEDIQIYDAAGQNPVTVRGIVSPLDFTTQRNAELGGTTLLPSCTITLTRSAQTRSGAVKGRRLRRAADGNLLRILRTRDLGGAGWELECGSPQPMTSGGSNV